MRLPEFYFNICIIFYLLLICQKPPILPSAFRVLCHNVPMLHTGSAYYLTQTAKCKAHMTYPAAFDIILM